jgi:hypothetical protein
LRQLVAASQGGVQWRERCIPGSRQVCPFAAQIPERTGQARDRFGQPAWRRAAVSQDAVDLRQ